MGEFIWEKREQRKSHRYRQKIGIHRNYHWNERVDSVEFA